MKDVRLVLSRSGDCQNRVAEQNSRVLFRGQVATHFAGLDRKRSRSLRLIERNSGNLFRVDSGS